jgi:hypothetical protein
MRRPAWSDRGQPNLYRTYQAASGPASDSVRGYIDDVRAGDYPGAYGRLCEKSRTATTLQEYTRIQAAQLKITSYEIVGVHVTNSNGRVSAVVTTTMVQETGLNFVQTFRLVKEDGNWRVCP